MSGLGLGGLFLQIGGAASSAIGSYYSAATQKINLKTQANLADINAKIAELTALLTREMAVVALLAGFVVIGYPLAVILGLAGTGAFFTALVTMTAADLVGGKGE